MVCSFPSERCGPSRRKEEECREVLEPVLPLYLLPVRLPELGPVGKEHSFAPVEGGVDQFPEQLQLVGEGKRLQPPDRDPHPLVGKGEPRRIIPLWRRREEKEEEKRQGDQVKREEKKTQGEKFGAVGGPRRESLAFPTQGVPLGPTLQRLLSRRAPPVPVQTLLQVVASQVRREAYPAVAKPNRDGE